MPKLNETFAKKVPHSTTGTEKYWDTEVRGLVLFVGKRSKPGISRRMSGARQGAS